MKLLILGGTRFLGRHLAEQALAAGHALTLLHRGQSNPGLFPEAEHLIADRDSHLRVLAGRRWDAVIDTCAYLPRQVHSAAALLAGQVGHYQLVSSISVYAGWQAAGNAENAALATLHDPDVQVVDSSSYGGLKALCEQAATAGFGAAHTLCVRPGLIVGPHDPTGRFTWWVQRLQRAADGSAVLAPGDPAAPVQYIDVRDLAAWMLAQAESGRSGVFNCTGPAQPLTMGGFLDTARRTLAPAARLVWVDESQVLGAGVQPWADLPVWLATPEHGLHRTVIAQALATGLRTRPLADTLLDTAAWCAHAPAVAPGRPAVGLAPEREAALLAAMGA